LFKNTAVSNVFVFTQRIRFDPYDKALAIPIMMIVIGHGMRPVQGSVFDEVPTRMITFSDSNISMFRDVIPFMKGVLGPFECSIHSSIRTPSQLRSTNLVVITKDIALSMTHLITKVTTSSHKYSLVFIPARFNSKAFRMIVPYVRRIYLISPDLRFKHDKKSFLGSVGLLIGANTNIDATTIVGKGEIHSMSNGNNLKFIKYMDSL
jgi:hypothetical protein